MWKVQICNASSSCLGLPTGPRARAGVRSVGVVQPSDNVGCPIIDRLLYMAFQKYTTHPCNPLYPALDHLPTRWPNIKYPSLAPWVRTESRHFVKMVRGERFTAEVKLVSFDVESLFTNVPVDESIMIIKRYNSGGENKSLKEHHTINRWKVHPWVPQCHPV